MIISIEYEVGGKRYSAHVSVPEIPNDATVIGSDKLVATFPDEGLGDDIQKANEVCDYMFANILSYKVKG